MSFHGLVETPDRSACVTSDPSGSRRSSRRRAESTTSSRPSGRKSMHIGNDATVTTTSWLPSMPSAITWFAPQSENQSRPSCQRGDSPKTTPSIKTSAAPTLSLLLADGLVRQTAPGSGTHRTPSAPRRPPPEPVPPPPPWPGRRTPGPARGGPAPPPTGHRGTRGQRGARADAVSGHDEICRTAPQPSPRCRTPLPMTASPVSIFLCLLVHIHA
jgi:hypothetical protein